jgi:hypothetical protein
MSAHTSILRAQAFVNIPHFNTLELISYSYFQNVRSTRTVYSVSDLTEKDKAQVYSSKVRLFLFMQRGKKFRTDVVV